jgi:single-stranded DNA-binding protein
MSIDVLINGKLIKDPALKTSQNDNLYCQFLLSVSVGEAENIVISGIAFGETAERIAQLKKGDALAVSGALKPREWQDKATYETKHGLSITVADVLSVYDIKRKRKAEIAENSTQEVKSHNMA